MIDRDAEKFLECMRMLGKVYNRPVEDDLMELYWSELKILDIDEMRAACRKHISGSNSDWWPTPGRLLRYVRGSTGSNAIAAWESVVSTMESVGAYSSVMFQDPVTHAAIKTLGSWTGICTRYSRCSDQEADFIRKDFISFYERYAELPSNRLPAQTPFRGLGESGEVKMIGVDGRLSLVESTDKTGWVLERLKGMVDENEDEMGVDRRGEGSGEQPEASSEGVNREIGEVA